MEFWQVILGLCVFAACFVVWPVFWRAHLYRIEKEQFERDQQLSEENTESDDTSFLNDEDATPTNEPADEKPVTFQQGLSRRWAAKGFKSRFFLICIALLLPIVSYIFYTQHGQRNDWLIHQLLTKQPALTKQEGDELYSRLQQRTKQTPSNAQAWYVLANMATNNQNIGEAIYAYKQVLALRPESPDVMSDLAKVLFVKSNNVITPEIKKLTFDALKLDEKNSDALGLAGVSAFQAEEYEQAIYYWEQALSTFRPNSPSAQTIEAALVKAELALKAQGKTRKKRKTVDPKNASKAIELSNIVERGSSSEVKQLAKESAEKKQAGPPIGVTVKVSLDEKVRAPKNAVVFVYARAWNGPKMPLAIKRLTVSSLPTDIVLDNSMAMAPGVNLSSFDEIELVARVSKNGNALAETGDWQVTSGKIETKKVTKPINLVISKQIK